MAIKIVKVAEPLSPLRDPNRQAVEMVRKARARADREGIRIGPPKVLIVVEQEFDDGN